jgi:phosphoribosyl 1,2-cyclic phosphate phosphodiesterase
MKITVLGCGTASGVPTIDGSWGDCDPLEPRNRRLRASILIETDDMTVLVDTSPDLRAQCLAAGVKRLDAVLFTHEHADHTHGIDDLRVFNWRSGKPIPIYADAAVLAGFRTRFSYIFAASETSDFHAVPALQGHTIVPYQPFSLGALEILPILQDHGRGPSLGFRIGEFAYCTDVKRLDGRALHALAGVKVWIVDCLRENPHPTHSHLAQTLDWVHMLKPRQTYLTHMNQYMDYASLCRRLPEGVRPAYDGLQITMDALA